MNENQMTDWDSYQSLAGDMWNELENLRELWADTEHAYSVQELIDRYEDLAGLR